MYNAPAVVCFFMVVLLRRAFCDVDTPHYCKDDGKCLTVIQNQQVTWEQAEEYCEKNIVGGRLASVHNAFDNSIIATWLPFLTTNPWIGGFRAGGLPFIWIDGTDFNQYTNWALNEPSNHCAQICRVTDGNLCQQGKWTTADCSNTSQIICEYGNFIETTTTSPPKPSCESQWTYFAGSSACYRTFLNPVTWDDAEETCRQNGAHLTSIHSDEENKFIGDFIVENSKDAKAGDAFTWIGMQDFKHNRQWSWSDFSATDYYQWAPGEPNNGGHHENCVEFYSYSQPNDNKHPKFHWNDAECETSERSFVCKKAPILSA